MKTKPITIAETTVFIRQAQKIWSQEEHKEFIDFIARNPELGDIIPDLGGIRKMRWSRQGLGKRAGARVIYFYHHLDAPLWLLLVYSKSDKMDMKPEEKKAVLALVKELKKSEKKKK
jgi:hypothetical protein